ncbi:MAG: hypothetical protein A2042_00445 [Candidatus Schekmanbacteria bacterium GWA2_38_11]|uniref:DUF4124 domain-containing protein n=1 Tax=Candidatus Schekmanbacteria bacterium GWA2_38_11 TaxID=1817876 RepID=A0A1F7REL6_9BACT|nr:MAG: hypothetical protein A2042_00445 [Candidatus Schekmanbacteria bacterium GWA2_38_11]
MKMKILLIMTLSIFFFLLPSPSSAAIYKFVDDQGVIHFVDTYDLIPEKYRLRSSEEKLKEERKEEEMKPQTPVISTPKEEKEAAKEPEKKKSEDEIIEEWNKKLQEANDNIAKAKAALDEAERFENRTVSSYSRENYTNADRKAAQEATEAAKKNLEKAQKDLDELAEIARSEAPYSWWRENFYK